MAKRKTISKGASSKGAPRHEPTGAVFGKRCKKQHIAASRALKKVGIGVAFAALRAPLLVTLILTSMLPLPAP